MNAAKFSDDQIEFYAGNDLLSGMQWITAASSNVTWAESDEDVAHAQISAELISRNSASVQVEKASWRSLVGQAKGVIGRFQSLLDQEEKQLSRFGETFTDDGSLGSGKLVEQVRTAFERQHEINVMSAQMHRSNYSISMYNYCRNRSLVKLLEQGRAHIQRLEHHVADLEHSMSGLDLQVQVQQERTLQLQDALESTKSALQQTVLECRRDLAQQQTLLSKQQSQIEQINVSRQKQNIIVDLILLGAGYLAVNSTVVDVPVKLVVLRLISPLVLLLRRGKLAASRKQNVAFQRLLKLFLLIYLLKKCQHILSGYGIYNPNLSRLGFFKRLFIKNDTKQ